MTHRPSPPRDDGPWWSRWQRHWAQLRAATNEVGAEVEQWPYDALARPAELQQEISRTVCGRVARFQVDCVATTPEGELEILVDALDGPPTMLGAKPSYHFFKRRDGSVHYGEQ